MLVSEDLQVVMGVRTYFRDRNKKQLRETKAGVYALNQFQGMCRA
jgi:hypothetical protein